MKEVNQASLQELCRQLTLVGNQTEGLGKLLSLYEWPSRPFPVMASTCDLHQGCTLRGRSQLRVEHSDSSIGKFLNRIHILKKKVQEKRSDTRDSVILAWCLPWMSIWCWGSYEGVQVWKKKICIRFLFHSMYMAPWVYFPAPKNK